jgi:peroxiredoxin
MASPETTGELRTAVLAVLEADGPLNERLAAIAQRTRKERPEFAAGIDRFVARLRDAEAGKTAPQPGEAMPPFILPDEHGRMISLEDLLKHGPMAICFHRGHWCPFCKMNMLALAKAHREIEGVAGHLVAITPERWRYSSALKQQAGADFPVLTDMDNGYALSLNIAVWLGPEMEGLIAGRGHALPLYQGNKSWVVPIPATFVVGSDGVIVARYLDPDYRQRMSVEDLAAALQQAR